jgi:hypothetical protein
MAVYSIYSLAATLNVRGLHQQQQPEDVPCKATRNPLNVTVVATAKGGSSSSFPVLGLLRPVTGVTKLNPSIFSKVFLNSFYLSVGILKSFLGSCKWRI